MSAEADPGLEEQLAHALVRVLEPLADAVESVDAFEAFLDETGLADLLAPAEREKLQGILEDAVEPVVDVIAALEAGDQPDPKTVVEAVDGVYGVFSDLDDLTFSDLDDAGERLLDFLLVRYLDEYHHSLYSGLALFGVIDETGEGPPSLDLSAFGDVLSDPLSVPKEAFAWADPLDDFAAFLLLYYLKELFWAIGLPASLDGPEPGEVRALTDVDSLDDLADAPPGFEYELRVPVISFVDDDGTAVAGFKLVPLPGKTPHLPGLAMVVFGSFETGVSEELADDWSFNVEASGSLGNHGFAVRPRTDGSIDVRHVNDVTDESGTTSAGASDVVEALATLTHEVGDGEDSERERVLLGTADASRLALTSLSARAVLRYDSGADEFLLKIELPTTGTLGVHPADLDGFLASVLPPEGIFYDFEVTVGWSSQAGLYIERGGTLSVTLAEFAHLGPVLLQELKLALEPGDAASGTPTAPGAGPGAGGGGAGAGADAEQPDARALATASLGVELGPLTATVMGIGLSGEVTFEEGGAGPLGPLDVDVGFKPPSGLGLAVDAGVVTGGGFLLFEPEQHRYAGVLQLKIGSLLINAVGLLTTRLPGGRQGFSLLVIIAGEFTPVQLGFGFTLNGIGGLLGINRSVKAKPLGDAVRRGTLDSVLFPTDPVANAQRIISDLRAIFPATGDVHVFGPMVRLGWGTPQLITGDLGVVLELPTFKIVLLGRLSAVLPDEAGPVIELNMAVAGVLDPPSERVAIDASLYDSRVALYTVSGDMALRSGWGDSPRFVLSVGGFNPRYQPPGDFPELRRVGVSVGEPGGNPSIEMKGYFAVTSNTAQVGAAVSLRAEAGPAKVRGHVGFDALFEFDPFKFVIDFLAELTVSVYGATLGVRVDGTLSGPTPWRVSGRVSVDLFLVSVSANINVTLGAADDREPLPAARIMPELLAALSRQKNWSAQLPPDGEPRVQFREMDDDALLVHPMSRLGVRQSVVPLEYDIERFSAARPAEFTRFSIAAATITPVGSTDVSEGDPLDLSAPTTEQFAPAQFRELTDQQKLDSPGFEPLTAGVGASTAAPFVGGTKQTVIASFETSIIDREQGQYGTPLGHLGVFAGTTATGVLDASPLLEAVYGGVQTVKFDTARRTALDRYRELELVDVDVIEGGPLDDGPAFDPATGALTATVGMDEPEYVVVEAATLERTSITERASPVETATTRTVAEQALSSHLRRHPEEAGRFRVVRADLARETATDVEPETRDRLVVEGAHLF